MAVHAIDTMFKINKNVYHGTQRPPKKKYIHSANTRTGKGYFCDDCDMGFWGRQTGEIVCPECGKTIRKW